jgi:hypothetical protein
MRGPGVLPSERNMAHEARHYRSHLREIREIASRSLHGHGERREAALADIDRIAAKALREAG